MLIVLSSCVFATDYIDYDTDVRLAYFPQHEDVGTWSTKTCSDADSFCDLSSNTDGANLTAYNNVIIGNDSTSAYYGFNGDGADNAYMNVPYTDIDTMAGSWTYSLWVNLRSWTDEDYIIRVPNGKGLQIISETSVNDYIRFRSYFGGNSDYDIGGFNSGEWYHLTVVPNAIYINGVFNTTITNPPDWDGETLFQIGGRNNNGGDRSFSGNITNIILYNKVLSADEIYNLSIEGRGYDPFYTAPPAPPAPTYNNFTVYVYNTKDDSTNINYTVEIENYGNYTVEEGSLVTDILLNESKSLKVSIYDIIQNDRPFWNVTKTNATYDNTTYFKNYSLDPYQKISAINKVTSNQILDFNVTYTTYGYDYTSDAKGNVYIPAIIGGSNNFLINKSNYFVLYETGNNFTDDFEGELYQSILNVDVVNFLLNTSITSYNITINGSGYTENQSSFFLNKDSHTIITSKNNYFTTTSYFDTDYLTTSQTLINLTQYKINITAIENITSASINNFNVSYEYIGSEFTYSGTAETNTGQLLIPAQIGTGYYNITFSSGLYETKEYNLTINDTGYTDHKFSVLFARSIYFEFRDATTLNLIDDRNVYIDLISDVFSNNYTTSNGTLYVTLLSPSEYIGRYTADNYTTRQHQFIVEEYNGDIVTLYLINDSIDTPIQITIIDQNGLALSSAEVRSLRYYLESNSYILQESSLTDNNGQVIHTLTLNDEYYRFMILYNDNTLKTTNPQYLTSNEITIQVDTTEQLGIDFASDYYNLDIDLTFNSATNNTRLEYSDISGIGSRICLELYEFNAFKEELINSSCLNTASGIILLPVYNYDDINHKAKAVISDDIIIKELIINKPGTSIGASGLVAQLILTLTVLGFGIFNIGVAVILVPLSLILGAMIGFHTIPMGALIILQFIAVVITVIINTER